MGDIRTIRPTSNDWNDGYERGWRDREKEETETRRLENLTPPLPSNMSWLQKKLHRLIWRLESWRS